MPIDNTLLPAVPTKHSSNREKLIIVFNGWLFFVINLAGDCMIVHQANNNKKSWKARANYPNGIFTTSNDASALHLF